MNLFIEYYKPKNIVRHGELLACLHENLSNRFIDKVFLYISDDSKLEFNSDKIWIIHCDKRPTFKDIFKECNKLDNEICILANADIFFDKSIDILNNTNLDGLFLAISRWNVKQDGTSELFNNAAAQDVWAFRTPLKIPDQLMNQLDFYCGGTGGPDNRLAWIIDEAGYKLRNPAKQIRVQHLHSDKSRNVTKTISGPYLCLMPNDDIMKDTEYIRLSGFNSFGNPIYL